MECKLDESFSENKPIKSKYLQVSKEYSEMETESIGLREQEMALRTQLSHLTPSLNYLKERRLLHRQFTHATTQCYEDQFNPFIPKQQQQQQQQQLTCNASIQSALSSGEEAENT